MTTCPRMVKWRTWACLTAAGLVIGLVLPPGAAAQGRAGSAGASARAAAPRDYTGYWVSVVTEHWHLRMLLSPKGDYSMLPLTAEARRLAEKWDPAADRGNECRSYGAPAIMRVPGRLRIHWRDDDTLQMDIDSGTQTRLFRFGAAPPRDQPLEWQGFSVAEWEGVRGAGRGRGRATGQLRVTTTHLRPGYLRKNGVPYSAEARLEEYFETFTEPNGDQWLLVTSIVTDPRYLAQPYATTVPFRKLPDGSGWDPTPCRVDEPR
ncbi:MAG: hypothetical protein HYY76_05715 [Acidobacteria bacterium]|nr:hypothetical protein [Acidobacteriota bacterium]